MTPPDDSPRSAPGTLDFPPNERTRVKRQHERACYDRETVHAILDAGLLCHVGYVWALGRVGTREARASLLEFSEREKNGWVRQEIVDASSCAS